MEKMHLYGRGFLASVAIAIAAMLIGFVPPAHADYILTVSQVGSNVVATGSGTIDLAGLTFNTTLSSGPLLNPSSGIAYAGLFGSSTIYTGVTGPTSFGTGGSAPASSGTGAIVGIESGSYVAVPSGYVSGNALSDTATWNSKTLSSLGLAPGTYTWTWGSGGEHFTLDVVAAPEPSSLLLLGAGLLGLMGMAYRCRRLA
jgi:hypothetical protein